MEMGIGLRRLSRALFPPKSTSLSTYLVTNKKKNELHKENCVSEKYSQLEDTNPRHNSRIPSRPFIVNIEQQCWRWCRRAGFEAHSASWEDHRTTLFYLVSLCSWTVTKPPQSISHTFVLPSMYRQKSVQQILKVQTTSCGKGWTWLLSCRADDRSSGLNWCSFIHCLRPAIWPLYQGSSIPGSGTAACL